MTALLDESTTWAEFGKRHLDRRLSEAITKALGLERPTLVQSRGIPIALEGKDLLCRARTGSGKTLCYAVPLVQRLLAEAKAKGSHTPLSGLILVPTKELIVQVHSVVSKLLTFCFDVLTSEALLSGQKYTKAELPSVLVTTPSSLLALTKERQGSRPLAETLRMLVVDEADLMFSFGYEEDMRALCALMPSTYQAIMVSATLSEEVEALKGLMLHKPVVLKLEEPRVTGKLSQFYLVCHKEDKYLILYTLLKLKLVSGKTVVFVDTIENGYKLKILLERFSINSAVLNAELPHASRQNIIQSFNQSLIDLLIATDDGFGDEPDADLGSDEGSEDEGSESEEEEEEEEEPPEPEPATKKGKKRKAADAAADAEPAAPAKRKLKGKAAKKAAAEEATPEPEAEPEEAAPKTKRQKKRKAAEEAAAAAAAEAAAAAAEAAEAEAKAKAEEQRRARLGRKLKPKEDEQFSLTRGVDLQGVSTVINADVPKTVRGYVHRVGRCARGGASGTALTLCVHEEERMLSKIIDAQAGSGGMGEMKALPMQVSDAERFRYRVEDMARGLTKRTVNQYRARELQLEALHSEKLKEYFEDHPDEKRALQRTQRQLRESKSIRKNLRYVPSYLVPEQLFATATPVQQAVREEAAASGNTKGTSTAVRRRRMAEAKKRDPLQGVAPATTASTKAGRKGRFTREGMIARDKRINPKTANIEDLPPLSGRKLWKLQHGKTVRSKTDNLGERKRTPALQRKRFKKFGF